MNKSLTLLRFALLMSVAAAFSAPTAFAQESCPQPLVLGEGEGQGQNPPCLRPLDPLFTCLDRNADGSFTAHMGFDSQNALCCDGVPNSERILPIGNTHPFYRNYFTFSGPIPQQCLALGADGFNCGQPTEFPAGLQSEVFNVTWDGAPMTWTLRTFAAFSPFYFESSVLVSGDSTQACTFDCAGTPFGTKVVDRCGVCDGDGQSCLGCDQGDQSANLTALDSATLRQKHLIDAYSKRLVKLDRSRASRNLAKKSVVNAQKLYIESWNAIWTLPSVTVTCTNTTICTQTSNASTIQSIEKSGEALRNIGNSVISRLSKFDTRRNLKKYKKQNSTAYQQTLSFTAEISPFQSVCS